MIRHVVVRRRTYIRDEELVTVMLSMGCLIFLVCCVGWKVKGFGGNEKEDVDDEESDVDKEEDEDEEEEEADEEVVESDSESLPSKGLESLVAFCLKDGNTVGARTDRPGIALVDLLRFLTIIE